MNAPDPIPSWLVPWAVWVIRGKVDPRPPAPIRIPDWAKWFPAWAKWTIARPEGAPEEIPSWCSGELAKVVEALKPAPPPSGPTDAQIASLQFWRGMSCWVTRIDHFPPVYVQTYCGTKYRLVIVPTLRGMELESYPDGTKLTDATLREYVGALQRMGYRVAGSQWGLGVNPKDEAQAAVEAVFKFSFDGWVMNGEKPYEGGGKSGAYVRRFRSVYPWLPFGWSPEPRLSLDHDVFRSYGVCYMPQAYPLENKWHVSGVMSTAVQELGYRPENVVPLVQAYKSPEGVRYAAESYAADARAYKAGGLCLYTANQCVDDAAYWSKLVL